MANNNDPHNYGLVALTRIDAHEQTCSVRYNEIGKSLASIYRLLWTTAGVIIMTLISTIGTLVWYLVTHEVSR